LLQKRSMLKDQCPGLWGTSCAGHVDSGEAYDHAAAREYGEELGRPAPELERLFKIAARRETGHEHVWVYRVQDEGPFTANVDEIDELRWFDAAELAALLDGQAQSVTPSTHCVLEHYREWLARSRT
jgi:isopentenyldiphosphate isomerase